MKILVVDTSSDRIILGLFIDGKIATFLGENGCKRHNSTLLYNIDDLLSSNNVSVGDIDYFGVCVGPGSFTGIRIGVATVNAFALANSKKVVEITSLETLDDGREKIVALSCGHGNYYVGVFGETTEYTALSMEEIEKLPQKKEILSECLVENLIIKAKEKIEKGLFVDFAKPFYIKKSSAERDI